MAHPIPTAKTAIKATLGGLSGWTGVDVRDDPPTEVEDVTRDAFWFEPTELPADTWDQIGRQARRITFRLGFTIAVIREGDDGRSAEDVMWTYLDDLMVAVKTDYSLGGVIQQVTDLSGRQINVPIPRAWQAMFTGGLTCISKPY